MRLTLISGCAVSTMVLALAACKPGAKEPVSQQAMTEEDKTLYTLGVLLSRNLESFQLKPEELELVKRGMSDALAKKAGDVDMQKYGPKLDQLHESRIAAAGAKEA